MSSKQSHSYEKMWKQLTKNAIQPSIVSQTKHKKHKTRGGGKTLAKEWFLPLRAIEKKKKSSLRSKNKKNKTLKQRGGFIRGGSRVLPTMQEQCIV